MFHLLAYNSRHSWAICRPLVLAALIVAFGFCLVSNAQSTNAQSTPSRKSANPPSGRSPLRSGRHPVQVASPEIDEPVSAVSAEEIVSDVIVPGDSGSEVLGSDDLEYASEDFDPSFESDMFLHRRRSRKTCIDLPSGGYFARSGWIQGEYLFGWSKSTDLPALASTGALGQTGTTVLFGGSPVESPIHSGTRWNFGWWNCPCQAVGVQGGYMLIANSNASFLANQQTTPNLAQPFLHAVTGLEDAARLAVPNQQDGSLSIRVGNQVQVANALFRFNLDRSSRDRLDFLAGYRYAVMQETLTMDSSTTFIDPNGLNAIGTNITTSDRFQSKNSFHGAELGFVSTTQYRDMSLEISPRVAFGNNHSITRINGSTTSTVPQNAPVTQTGGIYALPTNINTYSNNTFAVIPEINTRLSFQLARNMDFSVGHVFLYWNKVDRTGQAIDRTLNPTQFPPGPLVGAASPQYRFVSTDYWAQALRLGFDYRF